MGREYGQSRLNKRVYNAPALWIPKELNSVEYGIFQLIHLMPSQRTKGFADRVRMAHGSSQSL